MKFVSLRRYKKVQRRAVRPRRAYSQPQGLVSIGVVSAELVRRLTED